MKVYHGSLVEVRNPEIRQGVHVGDFGCGFYVTSSLAQARRFVRLKCSREGAESGVVSVFKLDEKLFAPPFKGKVFTTPSRAWANFVLANRKKPDFSHDFDFVRGPVANDKVYASFTLYEGGIISFASLIERLKTRRLFDQILFHTEDALACLSFQGSEEVVWQK